MNDIITYCSDTTALLAEVESVMPERLIYADNADGTQGAPVGFAITKTPTIRNGNETLSVVRVTDDELAAIEALTSVKILATVPAYGDLLADLDKVKANTAIYDRVHDQTPIDITDDTGNVIGTQTPARLIGGFS